MAKRSPSSLSCPHGFSLLTSLGRRSPFSPDSGRGVIYMTVLADAKAELVAVIKGPFGLSLSCALYVLTRKMPACTFEELCG